MGVSVVYVGERQLHRGGGADSGDFLSSRTAAENCSELCYYGMRFGGMGAYWSTPPASNYDPHFLKCIESPGETPLNGLRIQHASQIDTNNIDPLIPQMNVTDWRACMSSFLNFTILTNSFSINFYFDL